VSSPLSSQDLLLAQNVQPKAGTPGVSQESQPSAPSGASGSSGAGAQSPLAGFMPILLMLVIFIPFFFMMSRRQKKESQARASLKKGDRVMTNSGLIGELIEMDDRLAKVKIAPSVTVQFVANTISPFVEPDKEKAAPAKELKEAKAVTDKK
jgi:preprotein translocase subunit YajC